MRQRRPEFIHLREAEYPVGNGKTGAVSEILRKTADEMCRGGYTKVGTIHKSIA